MSDSGRLRASDRTRSLLPVSRLDSRSTGSKDDRRGVESPTRGVESPGPRFADVEPSRRIRGDLHADVRPDNGGSLIKTAKPRPIWQFSAGLISPAPWPATGRRRVPASLIFPAPNLTNAACRRGFRPRSSGSAGDPQAVPDQRPTVGVMPRNSWSAAGRAGVGSAGRQARASGCGGQPAEDHRGLRPSRSRGSQGSRPVRSATRCSR